MSDNHKKNISKNYSLNTSSKETTLNSISVSKLLKNKKNHTQSKLKLGHYPTIFKEKFSPNDNPIKGVRLFSAKTYRANNNTKLVKKNSFKNIYHKKNKINIDVDNENTLKNKNNHIFFTGLNNDFRNNKMKIRLKSATIHKELDTYSRKAQEMKKKFNLFEIYKRSNYYNKVVIINKRQRKFLSDYLKKELEVNHKNSKIYTVVNIDNFQDYNNSNNRRSYYNQLFNRMLTCFLKHKNSQLSRPHINSCEYRNY